MAKKKKNKVAQSSPISPTQYIKERARQLPIDRCFVNADWQKTGVASIIVVRRHPQGTFTAGLYLVDTFCRGVYNSYYVFSVSNSVLEHIIQQFGMTHSNACEYAVVHNIIYGAIDFAEEGGINPCGDFSTTRYILEEDTDDIPLLEYEFGENGKHTLYVGSLLEAGKYLPALKKNLGDNYTLTFIDEDDDDEFDDEFDADEEISYPFSYNQKLEGKYAYKHPDYPSDIHLKYPELERLLTTPDKDTLTPDELKDILALPHDELRTDLEQIAYREMARNGKGIYDEQFNPVIGHVVLLLGELHNEHSLKLILEIMRQNEEFSEYHFGDFAETILEPALYRFTKTKPGLLMDYLKEPGLYTYFRFNAMDVLLNHIPYFEPSRKEECIDYGEDLLDFLIAHKEDPLYMDGQLAGFLCNALIELHATRLLPKIEKLYATGKVDEFIVGNIKTVRREMERTTNKIYEPVPFNLKKIYALLNK